MGFKRLVILSDGTWQTPENDVPTNVLKLLKAIALEGDGGEEQVVCYDPGVGSEGSLTDRLLGGGFGKGLDLNIQQLYTFLCVNYDPGDEVYMFGFSRGAYTVRSLAGMVNAVGLCKRDHIQFVHEAYQLYRARDPCDEAGAARRRRERDAFKRAHGDTIPVTALVCFDTVGSLGIPVDGPLGHLTAHKYRFHDTTVGEQVQHAIHLVAIDENRRIMKPTLMDPHPSRGKRQVTQMYLWGHHGGIGGGNKQEEMCADIALRATIDEMRRRGLKLRLNDAELPRALPPAVLETPPAEKREGVLFAVLAKLTGRYDRPVSDPADVHPSALHRFQTVPDWRPPSLANIAAKITAFIADREKGSEKVDGGTERDATSTPSHSQDEEVEEHDCGKN